MNPDATLFNAPNGWQLIPQKTNRISERGRTEGEEEEEEGCVAGKREKLQMIDGHLFCLLNTT